MSKFINNLSQNIFLHGYRPHRYQLKSSKNQKKLFKLFGTIKNDRNLNKKGVGLVSDFVFVRCLVIRLEESEET